MSGLSGLFEVVPAPDFGGRIRAMTGRLAHRGPDGEGIWLGEGAALGHRRLARAPSVAAQPLMTADGRLVLALDGAILNRHELQHELAAAGAFATHGASDAETLLAGITHWGLDETLRRATGAFALALWDRDRRCLALARDRMGEKPLYWGWAGGALVFGSELKALRAHPGFPGAICPKALALYLRFAYVPVPRTIHPGVFKLEPGCILEVGPRPPAAPPTAPLRPDERHEGLAIRRYWSLNAAVTAGAADPLHDEGAALVTLDTTLQAAVGRAMTGDRVPGAFLSGGIDSSLIVALMQAQSSRPVPTFTIGFANPAYDESPFAAAVAHHLGTDHTALTVTEDEARAVIPRLPTIYDEPFADSSQIPTFLVSQLARRQVTVALAGDAGDELFGGYNRYFWGPRIWSQIDWLPHPLRGILGRMIGAVPVATWDRIGALTGGRISRPGDKAHRLAARLRDVRTLDDLYSSLVAVWPGTGMVPGVTVAPDCALDDPLPAVLADDPVARMMIQDLRSYLPDDIMCKVDRAAMAVGLATRAPFLDPAVLELSFRLPMAMKIRGGTGKWALRQILYRHVPPALIERPKTGFGIPVGDWLRGPLRPWAEDLLSPANLARDGLLDPAPIQRAWAEHLSGRRDWTHRLWVILMFAAWRDEMCQGSLSPGGE